MHVPKVVSWLFLVFQGMWSDVYDFDKEGSHTFLSIDSWVLNIYLKATVIFMLFLGI